MITTVTLNTAVDAVAELPRLDWGGVNRAQTCLTFPGGKGVNVAKAVAELGGEVVATGFVGVGAMGRFVLQGLAERGIECDFVVLPGDTRLTFLLYDLARGQETVVNNPAAYEVTPSDLEALCARLRDLAARSRFVVFSGSLAQGCPADTYAELTRLVQAAGARAVLDTSEEALRQGLGGQPYLVKPTVRELGMVFDGRFDTEAQMLRAAGELQERGIEAVVVSRGAKGALARFGDQTLRAPSVATDVVSPIGAGDAMLGGIVLGLERGLSPPEALALGTGAAASSLRRHGAAHCLREEAEALAQQVEVAPLA